MITIVLPVSRSEYLARVITSLELLRCNRQETNILAIVDGNEALYVRTRNLVNGCKFNKRLTVKAKLSGSPPRLDIPERRKRITAMHNQARDLIEHDSGWIFAVEDDTTFNVNALERLLLVADKHSATGMVMGVEVARWGVPYLGAWTADDIYETTRLTSVDNIYPVSPQQSETRVDAGGLFCTLIRSRLYKDHQFHSSNGLGPDVNFGLHVRRLGYENFLVWQVACKHYNNMLGKEVCLTPEHATRVLTLDKINDKKWRSSY
jgi:hypothetical protein